MSDSKVYDIILFDLDGTLTDPKVGITRAVQYALAAFGIDEPCPDKLTDFIGPPLKQSFMEYYHFDEKKAAEALEKYREYFSETGIYENSIFPGIPRLLGKLADKGKTLAVATAKPTVYAERILKHFEIRNFFSGVSGVSLENSMVEKAEIIHDALQSPDVAGRGKAVMIGDRKHDIIGARKTGIDSIAVLYGYGSYEELQAEKPSHIVNTVAELEALLLMSNARKY